MLLLAAHCRNVADELELGHATLLFADIGGSSYYGSQHGIETVDLGCLASRVAARLGYGESTRQF